MSKLITTNLPEFDCACGKQLDAATGDDLPRPGDLTVCMQCERIYQFDSALRLIPVTPEMMRSLDPEAQRELASAIFHLGVMKMQTMMRGGKC